MDSRNLFSKFFDYISGTTSISASELNKVEEEKLVPPLKDTSVLCHQPPNFKIPFPTSELTLILNRVGFFVKVVELFG